ncbi:hypothetical protein AFK24_21660 [Pseudomonas syringae]|uniref:Uncharacterized protein n=1 Tax=Pseudomonas syringae TaxID=317 RepID=A0A1C7YZ67_PSESX|nr:hypothetical protein AFK24_21660 [Pseudomonas syringae]
MSQLFAFLPIVALDRLNFRQLLTRRWVIRTLQAPIQGADGDRWFKIARLNKKRTISVRPGSSSLDDTLAPVIHRLFHSKCA